MSQGQRSRGSRSKVKLGKPGLKAMILAGGLTPTSSCIFICFLSIYFHSRQVGSLQCEVEFFIIPISQTGAIP